MFGNNDFMLDTFYRRLTDLRNQKGVSAREMSLALGQSSGYISNIENGNKQLAAQIVEALAFSDTSFFRNYDVFYQFEKTILPKLKEKCRSTKKLNIWSLGCSTGQEAYSIAISIDKNNKMFANWNINILASDLSSIAISKAQRGIYSNFEVQTGLNAQMILDYFNQSGSLTGNKINRSADCKNQNSYQGIYKN